VTTRLPYVSKAVLERLPEEWRCIRGEVPREAKLTSHQVDLIVRLVAEVIIAEASQGRRTRVPGLGVFRPVKHAPKRVTTHGREHHVPERTLLKFRAASSVRARVGGAP
jgi:nucleoid DNA-binding protein